MYIGLEGHESFVGLVGLLGLVFLLGLIYFVGHSGVVGFVGLVEYYINWNRPKILTGMKGTLVLIDTARFRSE